MEFDEREEFLNAERGETTAYPKSKNKKFERLTKEEEIELAKKIAKGDKEALGRLVSASMGLVHYVAMRYRSKGLSYDDLLGEGSIGLITAAYKWNYRRKIRFSTFAVIWIKKTILYALNSKISLVRAPVNFSAATNQVYNKIRDLENKMGPVGNDLIKKKLGKKLRKHSMDSIIDRINTSYCNVEINNNGKLFQRAEGALVTPSFIGNVENSDAKEKLSAKIRDILKDVRYGNIVDELYGISGNKVSIQALADRHRLSHQSIREWRRIAFAKIRKRHKAKEFVDYLQV